MLTLEDVDHCQQCGGYYKTEDKSRQQDWIGCDSCWRWYHYTCVGLEEIPAEDHGIALNVNKFGINLYHLEHNNSSVQYSHAQYSSPIVTHLSFIS